MTTAAGDVRDGETPFAMRGALRGPVVLLEESVLRVRQLVQSTDYAFCATADQCYVWRADSSAPTCYVFAVPRARSGAAASAHAARVAILPRPLNASAEPALLLCTGDGQVRYWDMLSDAFTRTCDDVAATQLPLDADAGERVTTTARVDPSQVVVSTSRGRLLRVRVYVQRGEPHLAHAVLAAPRGLLARWFGGSAETGDEPLTRIVVGGADAGGAYTHVFALARRTLQQWRVPVAGGGASAQQAPAKLLVADAAIHKTIASRVLYARGARYSAAASMHVALVDAAYVDTEDQLAVLYVDRIAGAGAAVAYGIAVLAIPPDAGGAFALQRLVVLAHEHAADPRPDASPRLDVSATVPPVAFVTQDTGVVVKLLSDAAGALEEAVELKPGGNRIIGACIPQPAHPDPHRVRWSALTTAGGILLLDMDVARAQQLSEEQRADAGGTGVGEARLARLRERLEKVVWFGEDAANPLQLDRLPPHLPMDLVQAAVAQLSTAMVQSTPPYMRDTVDLRTELGQRTACARRLALVVGHSGYLLRLAAETRLHMRADAELLEGARDLWRFHDEAEGSVGAARGAARGSVLGTAIRAVLADAGVRAEDAERHFFQAHLGRITALFRALLALAKGGDAVVVAETSRLVLALFFGAARYRTEHAVLYSVPAHPHVAYESWYAHAVCIELLEALFRGTLPLVQSSATRVARDAELRTQLCALAEITMDTYDSRIAYLGAAAAAGDAGVSEGDVAQLQEAYARTRPALLHPLVAVGRADRAFALAEQHADFRTLTALCFADAGADAGADARGKRAKTAHPQPLRAPADVRVEQYLDRYGGAFATELYQYYIQHGAYRQLLEPLPEHADLLLAFLADHPQYRELAWMHDIALRRFAAAGAVLHSCAAQQRESITAQHAMLSVGKLALLAAPDDLSAALADPREEARLEAWDDALDLVHVQQRLQASWDDTVMLAGAAPEARAERVALAVAPSLEARPALLALFVWLAGAVTAGHVASAEDIIDLLTLQDVSADAADALLTDYALATQVWIRMDAAPTRRDAALSTIWCRLYLQDDWHALSDTADKTDDEVIADVCATLAFRTVQAVLANDATAPYLLSPETAAVMPPPTLDQLTERFPGMPAAQIAQLHTALGDEHAALQQLLSETRLSAYFSQVLARASAFVRAADGAGAGGEEMHVERPGGDGMHVVEDVEGPAAGGALEGMHVVEGVEDAVMPGGGEQMVV
ncbi:hypothetical protein MSPP1_002191 [Malassezia sp. CBS 17886]|nr:hypothetical protein MSPP1_002191 [Malassezia sp. CBS 17886]